MAVLLTFAKHPIYFFERNRGKKKEEEEGILFSCFIYENELAKL